ncbi:MAG: protein kinase [Chloroflexota bacterium]
MDAWIGQQLGAYEIQERLGAGGMGVVYRAVHRRLGQARAIKVLPAMLAHDETFLTRFEREAKLASELRHPNIVMILDIAEERGVNYIVMELLEGRSLHEVIRKDGPLPLDRSIRLLAQLGDALDFAHQHGVVHRDIKPGNALVRADDHLTLFDFGIARAAEGARLTEANMRIGTAEYMAPETITIGESGPGTDLYALGIIGYEMLTGRVPFTGVNSQTIMYAQIHSLPAPPRTLRGDLPPQVEAVILRQLDKIPEQRYRTATEYVRALETARDGRLPDTGVSGPGRTSLLGDPPATANPSPRLPTGLWTGYPAAPGSGASTTPPPSAGPAPVTPGPTPGGVGSPPYTPQPRPANPTPPFAPPNPTPPGGRQPVPAPPTPPHARPVAPGAARVQSAIEKSGLSVGTIYKLQIGGLVLLLLLMCLLPTPHDPVSQSFQSALAFPSATLGGYILGGDHLGRDVLSRMMSGGRFMLLRLIVVGALAYGCTLLAQRQLRQRTGRAWLAAPTVVLVTAVAMSVSVLLETVIGFVGPPRILTYLGAVSRVLFGMPELPPAASWGGLLADGRNYQTQAPWLVLAPLAALLVLAVGLVVLGSGISDVLRQRARQTAPTSSAAAPYR